MAKAIIGKGGRLTLPVEVRQKLRLEAGDAVEFRESPTGYVLMPVRRDIKALKGCFSQYASRPVTVEEMNEATAEGALEGAGLGPARV